MGTTALTHRKTSGMLQAVLLCCYSGVLSECVIPSSTVSVSFVTTTILFAHLMLLFVNFIAAGCVVKMFLIIDLRGLQERKFWQPV